MNFKQYAIGYKKTTFRQLNVSHRIKQIGDLKGGLGRIRTEAFLPYFTGVA
jgi:hypothetical protein